MKNYIYIAFLMLCLTGCTEDLSTLDVQVAKPDTITVALRLNGEISGQDLLMTRSETESRDLIGIAVYKGSEAFAYGVFDNLDDVSINLLSGSTYKFKCTLIKDAKDKLYFYTDDKTKSEFRWTLPFITLYSSTKPSSTPWYRWIRDFECYNNLVYRNDFLDNLDNNSVSINKRVYLQSDYNYKPSEDNGAPIERFYGEINNYTPTVNGILNFDMKRVSFGLKLKVTGIPDGNVDVTYNGITVTNIANDYESDGQMFSMQNIYDAWQYANADYQEQVQVAVTWHRTLVNVDQNLGTKLVNVKRNAMNIIHIKLNSSDGNSRFGITQEQTDMGEESADVSSN